MAGGPHARLVTCDACAAAGDPRAARRVHEGSETDGYRCPRGHAFGVLWREVPSAPRWAVRADAVARAAWLRWRARRAAGLPDDPLQDWLAAEAALEEAGEAGPVVKEKPWYELIAQESGGSAEVRYAPRTAPMGLAYPTLPTGRPGLTDLRTGRLAWRHVDLEVLARALPPGAVAPVVERPGARLVRLDPEVLPFVAALDGAVTILPEGPFETPAGPRSWGEVPAAPARAGLGAWLVQTVGPLAAHAWPAGATLLAHLGIDTALVAFRGDLAEALAACPGFRRAAPLPAELRGAPTPGGVGLRLVPGPAGAALAAGAAPGDPPPPDVVAWLPGPEAAFAGAAAAARAPRPGPDPWDGAGQTVAVADDGLAAGPGLAGALAAVEDLAGLGGADGPSGHGTHVAGLLAGAQTGRVPRARLVFQAIGRPLPGGGRAPDPGLLGDALESAWARGARVHVDAWAGATAAFDLAALAVDAACWARPDLVVVAASGNRAGAAVDGVRSPALARSALAVGALDGGRPWPRTCAGASQGRPKPELWAEGVGLRSTVPGDVDPSGHAGKTGTSGAAALVGAAAVQVRQWLAAHGEPAPSSAVVRALLVHAADLVAGLPAGFGALTTAFLRGAPPSFVDAAWLAQGQVDRYTLRVRPGRPTRVTLAWTDPPPLAAFASEAQSRLRLVVREPRLDVEWAGDDRHPLQRLEVAPRSDRLIVEVHAVRVAVAADPALCARRAEAPEALRPTPGEPRQDFALVADGDLGR